MVEPSKGRREYKNENPIYTFSQELLWNYKRELTILCKSRITPSEFISFVTFIMIAREYEENAPTSSLYQHIQEVLHLTEDTRPSIGEKEDELSKELKRRREARRARMNRLGIPDDPRYAQLDTGMSDRSAPRERYNLTRIQFLELLDKDDFGIRKKIRLRQFISSHNTSGEDIMAFYAKLSELSNERSETTDLDTRIAYAINLNRYENNVLVDICYRIAKFCSDHQIKKIPDDEQKEFLGLITGSISGSILNTKLTSTEIPVLFIKNLISAALYKSPAEINNFVQLRYLGCIILNSHKDELSEVKFTSEDFWDFIYYNYPIFDLYQDIQWDKNGATFSILRKVIDIVAQDPLEN